MGCDHKAVSWFVNRLKHKKRKKNNTWFEKHLSDTLQVKLLKKDAQYVWPHCTNVFQSKVKYLPLPPVPNTAVHAGTCDQPCVLWSWQLGMHLCVAGWMEGGKVGYPTRFPSVKCGDNHVGVVLYREPVDQSSKYDAYCYRLKGTLAVQSVFRWR